MKEKLGFVRDSFPLVFRNPIYIVATVLITIVIFFLFIFLANVPLFVQAWVVSQNILVIAKAFSSMVNTIISVSGLIQIILMALIAILFGINVSMLVFKFRNTKSASGTSGAGSFGAALVGFLGAGCPACATSLLSVLGVAGGLSILPFKGIELTSASVLILFISIYFVSKGIMSCEECRI